MSMDEPLDILQQMREAFSSAPHISWCPRMYSVTDECEFYVGAVDGWVNAIKDAIHRKYEVES